jgi:bacterioferritin (cytochrome b1)
MPTLNDFLEQMNEALAWEHAGIIQYNQHSVMLTGLDMEPYTDFFHEVSEEARDHAEKAGEKIVAFGGVPTVEAERIRQAADLEGMLEAALALEEEALEAWAKALDIARNCDDVNEGTEYWLEDHVAEEQEHVDEMRRLTQEISFSDDDVQGGASRAS